MNQLQFLINNYLEVSLLLLFVLVVAKILLITFSFSTGFAGGYIFPSFFIGGTLGILVFRFFPFIPLAVCLVCVIAGVSVALLRSPIALALIIAIVFDPELVPAMAIALVMGFIISLQLLAPVYEKGRQEGGVTVTSSNDSSPGRETFTPEQTTFTENHEVSNI